MKTADQNRRILNEFGSRSGLHPNKLAALFKGQGFERLVLAGGGVQCDCLPHVLAVLDTVGATITHTSQPGTYPAFAIDIGCYAHMRKLEGRFTEIDLSSPDAKERMRSGPILDAAAFEALWASAPADPEAGLRSQE